jgi:putative transposase
MKLGETALRRWRGQKEGLPPKSMWAQAYRVLEVSRSGYYANAAVHKQRLAEPMACSDSVHLKAAFAASHKAYGSRSRRLRSAMAERGQPMGRHRIRTLIWINGLRPVWRRLAPQVCSYD